MNQLAPIRSFQGIEPLPLAVIDLETKILQHPTHLLTKKRIAELHRRARSRGLGAHGELTSVGMLIVGESRVGKSKALEDYKRGFPSLTIVDGVPTGNLPDGVDHCLLDADYRPIVMASVPSHSDLKGFVSAILNAFGYKARDVWDTPRIIEEINTYVREMKTDMIFIDEGHNLFNRKSSDGTARVVEFLKQLLNDVPCQFVIAGLPELKQITRYAPQLEGRLDPPHEIKPYVWGCPRQTKLFIGLLTRFERDMGLPNSSGLTSFDFARRIHVASRGGRIGWIIKLLSRALNKAVEEGADRVDLDMLGAVYAEFDYSDDSVEEAPSYLDEASFEVSLASSGVIDREDNPFFCKPERLGAILAEMRERTDLERQQLIKMIEEDARPTRLRPQAGAATASFGKS
jgi:hypothetical protein